GSEADLRALLPRRRSAGAAHRGQRPGPVDCTPHRGRARRTADREEPPRPRLHLHRRAAGREARRRASPKGECRLSLIVIVEDDRAIATGLAMNLRYEGHEVRVAHDGEEGLRQVLEPGVGLVVLDVMLPGTNGYEILRAIRERNTR